jgi:NAD(P)-dependent dehydrogenase (short-subunit alcohol dehydrogenase family)
MGSRLAGRIALVMGGGAVGEGWGNGKASAVLMAREGAKVAVADVNLEAARETCAIIEAEGGDALALACDVGEPDQVECAVRACAETFGGLDVLMNNVGVSGSGNGLFAYDETVWDRVFRINTRGVFTACRFAVPVMLERGYGRIVNVSSTAGMRVMGGNYNHAYAASKAAVIHFTRTLALEFSRQGLRCNCVVPGMIDTPHASGAIRRVRPPEEAEAIIRRRHEASPTGAQGTAWDVANAALYLASEEAEYVNGTALVVDGGYIWSTPVW